MVGLGRGNGLRVGGEAALVVGRADGEHSGDYICTVCRYTGMEADV